jgi:hypothetical protein
MTGLAAFDQLPPDVPPARVVVVAGTPLLVRLLTALMHRTGWRRPPPRVKLRSLVDFCECEMT